jgi:predicted Zn-dependent protease
MKLENSPEYVNRVRTVTQRLLDTAGATDSWDVYVLKNDEFNAFTTAGNNVYVYTGLLDAVQNDDELAVVLAHELGHNLARHVVETSEEKGNQALAGLAGIAIAIALETQSPGGYANDTAASLTSQIVEGVIVNPYSQQLEHEADHIGLFLMAEAGYDPVKAITLWERQAAEGGEVPKFFSTHPPSDERAQTLASLMPAALARRPAAGTTKKTSSPKAPVVLPATAQRELESGNLAFQRYEYEKALKSYRKVLSARPAHADTRVNLAVAHWKLGEAAESKRELNRALKDDPRSATAHYNLACVHAQLGEGEKAINHLDAATKLDGSFRVLAAQDKDLEPLRSHPRFAALVVTTPVAPSTNVQPQRARTRGSARVSVNQR